MVSTSLLERVEKYIDAPAAEACWLWTGYRDPKGYGRISVAMGSNRYVPCLAHRVIYELLVGPLTDGLELDHLCRTPACVNPDHVEEVTHAENMRRSRGTRAPRPLCPSGHELTGDNVYELRGQRYCRECHRTANREYARRRRAAA